ncbi:Protein lin-28 like [Pseudolycoriella hygida]|uniref:Protein lin-28 like n=1 Tax=Pseudolycoriella hygida TaxID=35572 RepID=A0A9Q0N4T2_9DIPT|nr:Protein lin-28 like [Pseudolycoriella hygida]
MTEDIGKNTDIENKQIENVKTGKCKWFNGTKGWGFVTLDETGEDVFVHQSILKMNGFRQLNEAEEVEVEFKVTDKGLLEAIKVTGPNGEDCRGSSKHPPKRVFRKIRCYNCGEFKNHVASKCVEPPQPKRCHFCKSDQHLVAECPTKTTTKLNTSGSEPDCGSQAENADGSSEQNQNV